MLSINIIAISYLYFNFIEYGNNLYIPILYYSDFIFFSLMNLCLYSRKSNYMNRNCGFVSPD